MVMRINMRRKLPIVSHLTDRMHVVQQLY